MYPHNGMNGELRWEDYINVDPQLLSDLTVQAGSWEEPRGNIGTAQQMEQEIDHDVQAEKELSPVDAMQPSDSTFEQSSELPYRLAGDPATPPPKQRRVSALETPPLSSSTQPLDPNAKAFSPNSNDWQTGNMYAPLSLDTSGGQLGMNMGMHMLQSLYASSQHGAYLTPTSARSAQGHMAHHVDNNSPVPQQPPTLGHGCSSLSTDYLARAYPAQPAANLHGWEFQGVPPSQNIEGWTQGPYNPTNTYTPNTLIPPSPNQAGKGKKPESIAQSRGSVGSYQCTSEGCDKTFEKKADLDHHGRYHDPNQKTKMCSMCTKSFLFNKDLRRHFKVHTKERHLLCNTNGCPYRVKGFSRKDHLNRHLRTQHGQE